jgi:hypothetical protein
MNKKITYYLKSIKLDRTDRIYHSIILWLNKKLNTIIGSKSYKVLYRKGLPLYFKPYITSKNILTHNTFNILNRSLSFTSEIPWNYPNNGKDWRDNLNFFFFLTQDDLTKEKGLMLLYLYSDQYKNIKLENENLVISYRAINWIKFISKHQLERKTLDRILYSDYRYLLSILAYNKGGYELLVNGISLLFGAYYFKAPDLLKEAKIILSRELSEQILSDGAHFQKSQMFHNLILSHLIDSYNLMQNNSVFEDEQLNNLMLSKICAMLAFNQNITYTNGDFASFNESVQEYIIPNNELLNYASSLNLKPFDIPLSSSGFRKVKLDKLEATIDIGKMGPDYCLHFAQASVFSFDLRFNNKTFIINNGTSTFEDKITRFREKSTGYHNTVSYKNKNQAEFFNNFKVACRPEVTVLQEDKNYFKVSHDGYKRLNAIHQREFKFYPNGVLITDEITHLNNHHDLSFANFHFHPDYTDIIVEDNIVKIGEWKMEFNGQKDIRVLDYQHPLSYNKRVLAKKIEICFTNQLTTKIIRLDY